MPKRQSDPVLQELQRVKQRIYRIQKQGLSSNAVRAYEKLLKSKKIDISHPSKLTEREKIILHNLNQSFLDYQTSTIRNIRKMERERDTSINQAITSRGGEALNEKELSIVYDALTKSHESRGHLSVNIYAILGRDAIIENTKHIKNDQTLERRFAMAERWIEAHPDDYYEEDIENILKKGRYPRG